MSKGFPHMIQYPLGRLSGKAEYVRALWESYAYNRPAFANRTDVKYTLYRYKPYVCAEPIELLLIEKAPEFTSIFAPFNLVTTVGDE